jgi:uncharacterized protein
MPTLLEADHESAPSESCGFDLGARLHYPESLFTEQIGERWVAFAPDRLGLPVVLDRRAIDLLRAFRHSAVVSDVLATQRDFADALNIIANLEERGFLRDTPMTLPYPVPPASGKASNFSIWLHITNWCNLGCEYCFVGEKTHDGMDDATMASIAEEIRSTALRRGTEQVDIKFAGGEATLVLPKIVYFRNLLLTTMADTGVRVNFGILSNGTAVTDRLIGFLKETGTGLSISVDGFEDSHDVYRVFKGTKRGSWQIVARNIQKLVDSGIKPYIMGTISEESCASLPELVRWIYRYGLRCRLSVVRQPKGNWAAGQEDEYVRLCTTLAEAFDRAFTVLEDPAITIDLRNGIDLCELHFDQPANGAPCGIASNHIVIKPDATLVACPMIVAEPGVRSEGDLLDTCSETFGPRPSERYVAPGKNDCRGCHWFPVCSGGCPITNLRIKGYAYTRSPLCAFYKSVIPRYLRFFGTKLLQAEQLAHAHN